MDDDVSGVDQYPVTSGKAFDFPCSVACSFQVAEKVIADGHDMAGRTTGSNHHVIAQCRFSGNVYGDNVFCLGFLKT